MKRKIFSACMLFCLFVSVNAQEKIFETRITAYPSLGFGANDQMAVYAGSKNLNVVQMQDGKMVLDKSFKDAGITVSKVTDAYVSDELGQVVLCDAKMVNCVDTKTGTKMWENKSFTELGSGSLLICDKYVLVSDKKGKDNFSLTCLSIADGKELWTIAGEKAKIYTGSLYFLPSFSSLGINTAKPNQFRLVDLETGKVDATATLEGSPIYSFSDETSGVIYIHHMVEEDNSYLSAVSMKDHKILWKTKAANKSPQTPMTMNTDVITYYAKVRTCDDKILLITEGIEAFNAATGKSVYNIPFVPYYKWGVGHYTNGIFEPVITPQGILIADRSSDDMYIKLLDRNTGKQIWSTDKLKDMDSAPVCVVTGNIAAVQFGGLNYFEVMNNTGIGKLLKPFTIMAFDLQTGKNAWTLESKKDFYYISATNDNIMIVGTREFQTVDAKTGAISKTEKNPFKEDYFMTKFDLSSTHKLQKNVEFDFSARRFLLFEEGTLSLSTF